MGPTTSDKSQRVDLTTASVSTSFASGQQAANESTPAEVAEKPTCGCCSHSKIPTEKSDGWKVLLEAMEQCDQKNLDRWKAEMDNLLIFAGLLSAVVTAFTVESYQWLRDDPAATSVILLAQISDKMTSFSVATGFINSTDPNPRPIDTSSFEIPDAVKINMLWILSLTFSLIAAFLALAVQQWLRHIPVPEDMTIRQSARLRQFRQEGLGHWRVPMLVSFLPILVQVAVILFLVGLIYLLRPLNHDIGLAFTVVAGSLLSSFAITAFLPFYYRDCPYKSSFFPTILSIVQPIAKFIVYIIFSIAYYGAMLIMIAIYLGVYVVEEWKNKQEMVNNKFGDPEKLWLNLELKKMMSRPNVWDESVLALAPMAVARSESSFNAVKECLKDLGLAGPKALCAFKWAAHHLGVVSESISDDMCDYSEFSGINPKLLAKVDTIFAERYRDILWEVLPMDGHEFFSEGDRDILLGIMILLMETTKFRHNEPDYPKFVQDYMDLLMKILRAQAGQLPNSHDAQLYGRMPTALFYEGCVRHKHSFRDDERNFVIESCQQLIPALKAYLRLNAQFIRSQASECEEEKKSQYVRLVFQHAMSSICDSLSKLAKSHFNSDIRKNDSQHKVDLHGDSEAIRSTLKDMLQTQKPFNDVLWEVKFPEGVPVPLQVTAAPPNPQTSRPLEKKPVEAPDAGSEEKLPSIEGNNSDLKEIEDLGIATLDR
ncbi:hypothetical protein EW026_g3924 [Hermanssonia centrifuga]|uniref:DUF6535 domain-containing protein n=1 Tax=Hermanssonia centrifuga TaxID=98765 RepID=A0A4S4KIQ4_9APHY|nr:hypothetical protein EW026_g3924 [Hermanssonia centrifuga]